METKTLKELFEEKYPHIYLQGGEQENKLFKLAILTLNEGVALNKVLDLLEDGIMSQGLAEYDE